MTRGYEHSVTKSSRRGVTDGEGGEEDTVMAGHPIATIWVTVTATVTTVGGAEVGVVGVATAGTGVGIPVGRCGTVGTVGTDRTVVGTANGKEDSRNFCRRQLFGASREPNGKLTNSTFATPGNTSRPISASSALPTADKLPTGSLMFVSEKLHSVRGKNRVIDRHISQRAEKLHELVKKLYVSIKIV